ncbi:MAG: ATP-binding protein [Acidobacteriota bacterium]
MKELTRPRHPFALMCGYHLDRFAADADADDLDASRSARTGGAQAEGSFRNGDADAGLRELSRLQERERALETELAARKGLEETLRQSLRDLEESRDALAQSEEDLRDFVENAAESLHWVGPDGSILWANKAELDLLGYARTEYVGHSIVEFHADRPSIEDILSRLARYETLRDYEARLKCKDGSIKFVLISSNVRSKDGKFIHTRCFTRDITERRALEHEREQLLASLQRSVRFSEMFLGILGHDLRNPLAAIVASASHIRRRSRDESLAGPTGRILSSAERMGRMINQLLDFTQIRLGAGIRLTRQAFDLRPLLDIVIGEIRTMHPGCDIVSRCTGDTACFADEDRVAQLISNLTGNAVHHGVPGSTVDVRIDGTNRLFLLLEFHNQGAVPPDMLPLLFEPFHENADKRTVASSGLGLGLYISKQIVLAHGGSIDVVTTAAGGTRVLVVLPRQWGARDEHGSFLAIPVEGAP